MLCGCGNVVFVRFLAMVDNFSPTAFDRGEQLKANFYQQRLCRVCIHKTHVSHLRVCITRTDFFACTTTRKINSSSFQLTHWYDILRIRSLVCHCSFVSRLSPTLQHNTPCVSDDAFTIMLMPVGSKLVGCEQHRARLVSSPPKRCIAYATY